MTSSPNVLLVVLDSVRAHNTSLLGHRNETTPWLDSFAAEATTYTQARAPSTWSLPSHVSLFTGRPTPAHGVHITRRLEPGHTVWEALSEAGYETGVFSSNVYVTDHPVGVGTAFDEVLGVPESVPEAHRVPGAFDLGAPDGFWYADQFLEWSADQTEPWAACVNVMDGHRPYLPREEYDEWRQADAREVQAEIGRGQFVWKFYGGRYPFWYLSALETIYDGGIRQADAVARRVIEGLRSRGELANTLVVVTSDHGDGLGEQSPVPGGPRSIAHTLGTHEHLTHVPLVVRPPGGSDGRRVDRLASLARFPAAVEQSVAGVSGFDADSATVDGTSAVVDGTSTATDGESAEVGAASAAAGGESRASDAESAFAVDDLLVRRRPIDGPKLRTAEEYCGEEYERYVGESAAVYRDRPGRAVEKTAIWQDEAATVLVHDAQGRITTSSGDPAVVTERLQSPDDGLWLPRETDEAAMPEEVLQHLADIGYR